MSFFEELKRRNVFRVAIGYIITAWLLLQVVDLVLENINAPDWVMQVFMLALAIGFPLAVFFAWAFEMTPEGLKRESEVDRSQSITHETGQKLNYTIIAVLVAALGYFAYDKLVLSSARDAVLVEATMKVASELTSTEEATVESDKSIAVLPFVNMSSDAEQEYFSDGISEEILNALVAVEGLAVVGRTSSFAFKGKNEDLRAIGATLGVDHLVEGSVRKSGVKVRITAQLIRADNGMHLWSETYDREISDIFKVQDEISAAIAGALKVTLLGAAERPPEKASVDPEAFDLYLRARREMAVPTATTLAAGIEKLEQVKRLDPGFLDARVELSRAFWTQANYATRPVAEALALAEAEARAVLAIDPDFGAAYLALAAVSGGANMGDEGDEVAALEYADTAVEKGENTALAWVTVAFFRAGNFDFAGARVAIERAVALDPMNADIHNSAGQAYSGMGDRQAAMRSYERSIALRPSTDNWWNLAALRQNELGDTPGAIAAYRAVETLDPNDPETPAELASAWLDIGRLDDAAIAIKRALDLAPDRGHSQLIQGEIMRHQGRQDEALALMQASIDNPATVHRMSSFFRLTAVVVGVHMRDGNFDAAQARLLKSFPELEGRLTTPPPADLRHDERDPTPLLIQILRARGEDGKAVHLSAYTNPFGEDYLRALGLPADYSWLNWELASAMMAAGNETRALDYLTAAYEGGMVGAWRDTYDSPHFYALWDHPRHKALMARIEADMVTERARMETTESGE